MRPLTPDYILDLKPYKPGKPLEELQREYGISDSIKLASNENPLGPSPKALAAIRAALGSLHRYPDAGAFKLKHKIAAKFGLAPANVVLGNGSDEIIGMLTRAFLQPGDEVILPKPSFLMYSILVRSAGAHPIAVPLKGLVLDLEGMRARITPKTRMIFLCNPNNPTGAFISDGELGEFLETVAPELPVVVDEAYFEFVRDAAAVGSMQHLGRRALVTLRTFSKVYGLAGLRIGFGVMAPEIADILNRVRQPFNASNLAQAGALAALDDTAFLNRTIRVIHEGLDFLYRGLDKIGVPYFRSQANFFMIDVGRPADAVFEALLREGVIVRSLTEYGFPSYIRINAGLPPENTRFLKALTKVLA